MLLLLLSVYRWRGTWHLLLLVMPPAAHSRHLRAAATAVAEPPIVMLPMWRDKVLLLAVLLQLDQLLLHGDADLGPDDTDLPAA